MFLKNISAIKVTNPVLADELTKINLPEIQVIESENKDFNLIYKGIPLHSIANPVQEAEDLFNSLVFKKNPSSVHIVYGLGLGYLFKRIYMSVHGRIILFEPNLDILRFTLEFVDFSQEFQDKRIFICTTIQDLFDVIKSKYIIGDKLEVCCLPSYINLAPEFTNSFIEEVITFIKSKQQDQSTMLNKSEAWALASVQNIDSIIKSISCDIGKDVFKDLPAVIVSAGPSLEENIDLIKENRNKFILITVNTALKALLKNNIIPDFCVISENFDISYQFEDLDNLDKIRFILSTRVQPFLWNLGIQPNMVYYTETDGLSQFIKRNYPNVTALWPSAGSVSINAFYVAALIFGCNPIILVGQDLAFVNNQVYSKSIFNSGEEIFVESNKIISKLENTERNQAYSVLKTQIVKNQYGDDLLTGIDYYEYINQYEDILKNELPKSIKVINTSLNGAFIKGMLYESFEKVLENLNDNHDKLNGSAKILESKFDSNKYITDEIKLTLNKNIDDIIGYITILTQLIQQFLNANNSKLDNTAQNILGSFYSLKKEFSNKISSNDVIFFMIQKYSIEYINTYLMPENDLPQSIEDICNNMNTELIYLNNVKNSLETCKTYL